jgi:hypothetical protein
MQRVLHSITPWNPVNDVDIVLRVRETDCTVACKEPGKENNKTVGTAGKIQRARVLVRVGEGPLDVLQSNDYLPCGREIVVRGNI